MATKRQGIEAVLKELLVLAVKILPQDHVRLQHVTQRFEAQTRGVSVQLDRSVRTLGEAVRHLVQRSRDSKSWQGVVSAMAGKQKPKALLEIAEFAAVASALSNVSKLVSQLPPDVFEPNEPERKVHPARAKYRSNDPVMTGEMIPVKSDNVDAVSFDLNQKNPARSMLRIRYKQPDRHGGKTRVPGATYGYSPVSPGMFKRLLNAGSKGGWIWDELRVRGTVAGYRVPYTLLAIRQGYVPRRARVISGQQWLVSRTKTTPDGRRTVRSQLASRRIGSYRPASQRPSVARRSS